MPRQSSKPPKDRFYYLQRINKHKDALAKLCLEFQDQTGRKSDVITHLLTATDMFKSDVKLTLPDPREAEKP